jgi:hypothetical protein
VKEWAQVAFRGREGQQVARQQVDLVLPPGVPAGRYRLLIQGVGEGMTSELGNLCVADQGTRLLAAGDVSIPRRYEVALARGVRLLGYEIPSTPIGSGEALQLTLYWQAQSAIEQRYKVFTHALGETFNAETGSFIWGQQDNEPVSNTRPTPTWRAGEIIVDSYAISIAPDAPSGEYTVEIGMYDPATGARLPVLDRQGNPVADHIMLLTFRLSAD